MRAFRIGCSYIPSPRHRHQFPLWMMEVRCSTDADADRREPAAEGRWPGRWLQERLLGKHVCAGGIVCQHGGWWGWVVARHPPPVLGWVVQADFTWPFREPRMMCGSRETPGAWMYRMLHKEPLCDYLLLACQQARRGLRSRRTVGILGNSHEHSGALIRT